MKKLFILPLLIFMIIGCDQGQKIVTPVIDDIDVPHSGLLPDDGQPPPEEPPMEYEVDDSVPYPELISDPQTPEPPLVEEPSIEDE